MRGNSNGVNKLCEASSEAAGVLLHLMRNAASEEVRLEAARAFLNSGELVSRMSHLERSMAETAERVKWSLQG